jgi:hypothetical protein
LKYYGESGKFYNLVKSYLDGRYQKVILSHNNGIESTWKELNQGVPQGSILGPILFHIYIKNLPKLASIVSKILLYADDISVIVTGPNLETFIHSFIHSFIYSVFQRSTKVDTELVISTHSTE